ALRVAAPAPALAASPEQLQWPRPYLLNETTSILQPLLHILQTLLYVLAYVLTHVLQHLFGPFDAFAGVATAREHLAGNLNCGEDELNDHATVSAAFVFLDDLDPASGKDKEFGRQHSSQGSCDNGRSNVLEKEDGILETERRYTLEKEFYNGWRYGCTEYASDDRDAGMIASELFHLGGQ
ncbi:MAG: hypothetical protein ACRD5F_15935, partial [Candidatus Acidiferrales bacterium]